ncbi:MFS transporter [Saccharospirillum sp. MSK14-1]|uniref:cytochrome c oxidase subunit 3 n=1 Tax=Saccharospirillum sp. MSK14-1 TaxID=1897632 RepID=UPI000D3C6821|nr:cytochrome c oxidase subunit 3 [Saccharospirillum sp. MSK14-1]PTY37574.1 MFS transporter [Saccharospirillum sp. MSK14-1]
MSSSANHEHYYVPAQSRLPIWMAFAMFLTVFGLGSMMRDMSNGATDSNAQWFFIAGFAVLAFVLYSWFSEVIRENHAGLNSPQLKQSYVWGMGWFIFSEVMFFAAFFGALFYVRNLVGPWLGGEGAKGVSNYLYPGFEFSWPLLNNPDNALFQAPEEVIHAFGLPLINTIILVISSITLTIAHHALRAEHRTQLKVWLGITILLGIAFLILQAEEYIEAYTHLGLTLESGIYGSTFFMLTGFHGAHVTIGTLMLIVQFVRALRGHFKPDDHFGFEASAWYWHFVDVVWLCLFVLVYWI